ncbi:hypothetical protein OSB04_016658 [Centaurea solstitialis]|uniref:Uncharacterized protein n=1 Tax=Centaurea solstitialis TaxID=347529 RepID=A0AA38T1D9_9ASTR|nr:hypothetical protein OSB04_016658 [Centaurea solstitialis]
MQPLLPCYHFMWEQLAYRVSFHVTIALSFYLRSAIVLSRLGYRFRLSFLVNLFLITSADKAERSSVEAGSVGVSIKGAVVFWKAVMTSKACESTPEDSEECARKPKYSVRPGANEMYHGLSQHIGVSLLPIVVRSTFFREAAWRRLYDNATFHYLPCRIEMPDCTWTLGGAFSWTWGRGSPRVPRTICIATNKVSRSSNLGRFVEDRRYFTCESVGHHRAGLRLAKIDSSDRELFRLLLMKSTGECFVLAKSKFDPPFIGSFEIVERFVPVASRLDLPVEASRMRRLLSGGANCFLGIHVTRIGYSCYPNRVFMLPESGIPDSRTGRSCDVQMPFRIGNHDFRIGIWPSLDEMLFVLEVEFPSLSFPYWVSLLSFPYWVSLLSFPHWVYLLSFPHWIYLLSFPHWVPLIVAIIPCNPCYLVIISCGSNWHIGCHFMLSFLVNLFLITSADKAERSSVEAGSGTTLLKLEVLVCESISNGQSGSVPGRVGVFSLH